MPTRCSRVLLTCMILLPAPTVRGQLSERFTLGRFIPDDVWLYIHAVQTPESKWIDEQWSRVGQALRDSGVVTDVLNLVLSFTPAEERQELEERIRSSWDMISAVSWSDIFQGGEFAFAERGSMTSYGYDYLLLSRSSPERAEANYQALVRIMQHIGSATPRVRVASQEVLGTPTQVLFLSGSELGSPGMRLTIFRKNDVLVLVTGKQSVRDVLRRLDGDRSARSIADLPRFRSALEKVPPPQTMVTYGDIAMLMRDIAAQMRGEKLPAPPGRRPQALDQAVHVVEQFNIFDYFVSSTRITDRRQITESYGALQKGKEDQRFARILTDRKSFETYDRFIPETATSFSLNGLINFERLYHGILGYLREEMPQGPEMIDKWNAILAQVGFDPQRDLFDWWSGEIISISLPAAMITPMSREDFVLMIRVKDSELAARKVNALLDSAASLLRNHGQMLMLQPAKVQGDGFRQITHPMLTLLMQPVVGVHDGWLWVSSSPAAINRCLNVAKGEAPSIRKNPRYTLEGIVPDGPCDSVFFTDMSRFGEELSEAVGMIGIVAGMLPMFNVRIHAEELPGGKDPMKLFQQAVGIAAKLGPVLREIDFYSSHSGVSRFDGSAWREQRCMVYKSQSTLDETRLARNRPANP